MAKVKLGKLISGEIVVGQENEPEGLLEHAYLLNIIPDQANQGQFNIIFLPLFIPITKESVTIPYDRMITLTDAPDNLVSEYTRINSDLVIPTPGQTNQILRGPTVNPRQSSVIPNGR